MPHRSERLARRVAGLTFSLVLAACGGAPASSAPPASQSAPSPSPVASEAPAAPSGWMDRTTNAPVALAAAGEQAVGISRAVFDEGQFLSPVFWSTPDGEEWSQGNLTGASDGLVLAAAAREGGFVAVGIARCNSIAAPNGQCEAAAWWSADGREWQRLSSAESRLGAQALDVTATPDGFLAVGSGTVDGAVWRSTSGQAWELVPATGLQSAQLSRVVWAGTRFVAVGIRFEEWARVPRIVLAATPRITAGMWVSEDGSAWREVADVPNDPGFEWTDIAASGSRVVAIGPAGDQVLVMASPDAGLTWVRASSGLLAGPSLASVAGSSLGFMAVGRTGGGMAPVAIGSTDGMQWVELPTPPDSAEAILTDVVATTGGFIVSGLQTVAQESTESVQWRWSGPPVVSASSAPSPAGVQPLPTGMQFVPLDAGTYVTTAFQPTMQVTVDAGWSGTDDVQLWALEPTGAASAAIRTWHYGGAVIGDPCADATMPMPSVTELLAWLRGYPGLSVTELASPSVSGYAAHLLEIRADSITKCPNAKQPLAVLWTYQTSQVPPMAETLDYGAAERVLIIDHPDGAVITTVSSMSPDDMPLLWEKAQPVLDSIAFAPAP